MSLKLIRSAILLSLAILNVLGQSPVPKQKPDSNAIALQREIQLLDSRLNNINSQLRIADSIQNATLTEVTRDTWWEDVKTNLVASFIYDILGFNGNTAGSIIAKILSGLYLVYLILKARYWWKNRKTTKSKTPILDTFGGIITCLQAIFAFFVFFASFLFSDNDILDKTAFNEANKSIQILNKEIENLRSVDFVNLSENLRRVQHLKVDTLRVTDMGYLHSLEKALLNSDSAFKKRFDVVNQKIEAVQRTVTENHSRTNFATRGWQAFQTIILILLTIGLFAYIRFDLKNR